MKRIEFHPDAAAELTEAIEYYHARAPDLGEALAAAVSATLERIRDYPQIGRTLESGDTRRYPVARFPYAILYLDLEDFIWVNAVSHSHRRPEYWRDRQPPPRDES